MPVASRRNSARSGVRPSNGSRLMQLSRRGPGSSRPASNTKMPLPVEITTSSSLIPPPLLAHHHAREMALKVTSRSEAAEQVARYQAAKSIKSQQANLSHLMSTMPSAVQPSDTGRIDLPATTHSTERILVAPVMNPARYERMLLQRRLKEEALRKEKEAKEARLAAADAEAVRIGMKPSGRLRPKGSASVKKPLTPQHRLQSTDTLGTSTISLKKSTAPTLPKQNPSALDFASLQQKANAAGIAGIPPPPRDMNNQIPPPPPLPSAFGTLTYKVSLDTHLMQSLLSFDNGLYTREVFIEDPLQPRQPTTRHVPTTATRLPSTQFANETEGATKSSRRLERRRTLKLVVDPQRVDEVQTGSRRPLPSVLKTERDVDELCDRLASHAIAIDKATLTHALLSPDNAVKEVYYPKALEKYNTLHARVQIPTRMMRRMQAKSGQRKLPAFHQKEKRFEATFDVRHKSMPAKERTASEDALEGEHKPVQEEEEEGNKSRVNSFWELAEREKHRKIWSSREGRRDGRSRTRTLSAGKAKAKRRPISRDEATRIPRHRPRAATMNGTITKYTNGARLQHMGSGLSERYQMYNGSFFETATKAMTRSTYQAPPTAPSPTAVLHMPVMIKYTPTVLI